MSDSGRKITKIECEVNGVEWSAIKDPFKRKKYYPGLFIYSTGSCTENSNGKIFFEGKKIWCGDLVNLYLNDHIGRGKKSYAECGSTAQLAERLKKLAKKEPQYKFECISSKSAQARFVKKRDCFHIDDFSRVLNNYVREYWDMPCGESKVFWLSGGHYSRTLYRHAMVIRLEKKNPETLVIRHWDPNRTFLDQKVILGHQDCAQYLNIYDLYTPEQVAWFFGNGIARLCLCEEDSDENSGDMYLYWHVVKGDGLVSFKFQDCTRNKKPNDDFNKKSVENCIKEIIGDNTKTVTQKENILAAFIDNPFRVNKGLTQNSCHLLLGSDLSLEFKHALSCFLNQYGQVRKNVNFTEYFIDILNKLRSDSNEVLAGALEYSALFDHPGLLEEIIQTVLTDCSKSCEEKKFILNSGGKKGGVFLEAMANGNYSIANIFMSEIIKSDLPDEIKVELLEAKHMKGRSAFWEAIRFHAVDVALMYVQIIKGSDLDTQLKKRLLPTVDSLTDHIIKIQKFNDEYDKNYYKHLNDIKEELKCSGDV